MTGAGARATSGICGRGGGAAGTSDAETGSPLVLCGTADTAGATLASIACCAALSAAAIVTFTSEPVP